MDTYQAERLVVAMESMAKSAHANAVANEEQMTLLSDIHRRLAEIATALEKKSERQA